MPRGLDLRRQIVAQRSDQVELYTSPAGGTQSGAGDVLTCTAAADIIVFERHAAESEDESAVRNQLVPTDVVAGDLLLRADDMRQDHRRGARAVAADRADIAAGHVQKAMQLARRVVEPSGARPAIGATEHGAWSIGAIDALQFRRDEVERPRPADGHEFVAPPPGISPGTAFEPATPNHWPGDARPMRNRGRDIAEQQRRIGVARMRHDLDGSVAKPHGERAPMRAVRDHPGLRATGHVRWVLRRAHRVLLAPIGRKCHPCGLGSTPSR